MTTNWRHHAACRDEDPELFFPLNVAQAAPAVAVCNRCPVAGACLDWALETGQAYGIWGGQTEHQLRQLRQWTDEQDRQLVRLYAAGVPLPAIAAELGRATTAVKQRVQYHRLTRQQPHLLVEMLASSAPVREITCRTRTEAPA